MSHANSAHPPTASQCHREALQLLDQGLVQDAVLHLRRAVLLDPSCAPAWNDLGVILEALGNRRDAVECYRRAIRAQPGMKEPRRNLLALAAQAAVCAGLPSPVRGRSALAAAR